MFLLLLLTILSKAFPEEICYGKFCLEKEEGYGNRRLPAPPVLDSTSESESESEYRKEVAPRLSAKVPVIVDVSPVLSEVFKINDNDFSITFDVNVKFNWVDNRLRFKNMAERMEGEHGEVHPDLLDHIWVPPVQIRHMESAKKVGVFSQRMLNIIVKGENIWFDMGVNTKPTITCKMRFNWYPFDEQVCQFVIQAIPDSTQMKLNNTMDPGDFFSPEFQNARLDYVLQIEHLPEDSQQIGMGPGFEEFEEFYGKSSRVSWSQTGFQMRLRRRWGRYIFNYYIPSSMCVFASWASFLLDLDNGFYGRCGLLVTLFLAMTTILVSTIDSSPRVGESITALTAWILIQYAFLTLAMAAFSFFLAKRRFSYSKMTMAEVREFEKKLDTYFLVLLVTAYLIINLLYWSIMSNMSHI